MGDRLVHGTVALAVVASAGLIGLLLLAPYLPAPTAMVASPRATPRVSAGSAPIDPPLGLFALRGALSVGPCIAIELTIESYPADADAPDGAASVLWWQRGMTGCDTRSTAVTTVPATVTRIADEDAPDGEPIGYALRFAVPAGFEAGTDAPRVAVQLTILARGSSQVLIQAVESAPGTGGGLVFDRVDAVEPELVPIPSQTPVTAGPDGLFVLEGRFGPDGPCLVLDLRPESYSTEAGAQGEAAVRWWEPATPDPDDPAECLRRAGDVLEVNASVIAVTAADDPGGPPIAFALAFSLPVAGSEVPRAIEMHIPLDAATPDRLSATAVVPEGIGPLSFYRVDSIDPPLGASPGASPGG